jgi:hypothetical protein
MSAASGSDAHFPHDLGWVDAIADRWPAPIAHEYHHLRAAMTAERVEAAVWQLKDVAEVIVKFHALVIARDILEHCPKECGDEVRRALFARRLMFGTWLGMVRETLAPIVKAHAAELSFPEMLRPLYDVDTRAAKPRQTDLCGELERINVFRNDVFAHGASREDLGELGKELIEIVRPLNEALRDVDNSGIWNGCTLRQEEGEALSGWQWIERHRRVANDNHPHGDRDAKLLLVKQGAALQLWPLIGFRICTQCGNRDVFLYDSRSGDSRTADFILLDYFAGHRIKKKPYQEHDLEMAAREVEFEIDDTHLVRDDYGKAAFEKWLLEKASAAKYLPPDYLHAPLTEFLDTVPKGVFLLTAPANVGKSVFVRGIADPEYRRSVDTQKTAPWLRDALVGAFAIKREIQYSVHELARYILHRTLQAEDGFGRKLRQDFPRLDVTSADSAAAFAAFVGEVMALKPPEIARVVLFVDGLDELRPGTDDGIERFLPAPDALPDDF